MINKLLLILQLFNSTPKEFSQLLNSTPKEFSNYTEEFFDLFPTKRQNISFEFLEDINLPFVLDPYTNSIRKAHGYCNLNTKKMYINYAWWTAERSSFRKKKVIFHELGHCILGLDHPKDLTSFTIMNSILNTADSTGVNWQYLKKELKYRYRSFK